MLDVATKYAVPPALAEFIDDGFLEPLREDESRRTIEFHIPSRRERDAEGRVTTYSLTWIHPDFNDQYCDYFFDQPGDAPNFYVTVDTTDVGDEQLDLNTIEELADWLARLRAAASH